MLAGAFSCHHLNAHRSDEYIVPEASDGDVTDTACPGRILLVEQQVSLSLLIRDRNRHTSDFPRRTKPIRRRLPVNRNTKRLGAARAPGVKPRCDHYHNALV